MNRRTFMTVTGAASLCSVGQLTASGAAATGGRIGYIHIPDMGSGGLVEFNRWFYPQLDKDGMIVDCRWHGGGFDLGLYSNFARGDGELFFSATLRGGVRF